MFDSADLHVEPGEPILDQEALAVLNPLAGERERVRAIKAHFANDPEWAIEAIEKGYSLLEARAHSIDYFVEKGKRITAELEAKIATLETRIGRFR